MADEDQRVLAQLARSRVSRHGRVGGPAQVHDVAQHVLIHLSGRRYSTWTLTVG